MKVSKMKELTCGELKSASSEYMKGRYGKIDEASSASRRRIDRFGSEFAVKNLSCKPE
jgi:hypothetical protein